MANKIVIWITDNVNLSGLQKAVKGLSDIKDGAEKMHRSLKDGFEAGKKAVDVFFAPLRATAVPAIAAVTTSIGLMLKSIREWAGQELGEADVKSALIAMGQYTDQYRDQLIQLSDTYQTTTGIADDMWLKSLGQLTRFGMNASNVDRVSEALKNLTGLMDGNLDGATDMLAKAMQGEFGMFSRYGIIIKQTGDQVKDLDAAITAINAKGVGLLEARAATLVGKWGQLKIQGNELFEAMGKKLADSLEIGNAVTTAKGWLATLTASVQNGGLGDLIAKGGKELKEHIEAAVTKAGEIATAIKNSGNPLDKIFADAMTGAAEAFMTTLKALLIASMEIWKAVGIVIFNAFKEQALLLPGAGPIRDIAAGRAFDKMSPAERSKFASENGLLLEGSGGKISNLVSAGPVSDDRRAEISAKLATMDAEPKIKAAIDNGAEKIKAVGAQLKTDLKATVDKTFGINPAGEPVSGKSPFTSGIDPVKAQQEYAQKMIDSAGVAPGAKSTHKQSTITTTDADGNEVTRTLEEQIAKFKKTEEENAKTVETNTANAEKTTESSEASSKAVTEADTAATATANEVKKTSEESKKTLEATKTSNAAIETALRAATAAAKQSELVATTSKQTLDQVAASLTLVVAQLSQNAGDISMLKSQLRSMRA